MKAVRIFSFCFLYMAISVQTEDVVEEKSNVTTRGFEDWSPRLNTIQDPNNENVLEKVENETLRQESKRPETSGQQENSNRFGLSPPPSAQQSGSNSNSWHDLDFDSLFMNPHSNTNSAELLQQQNAHTWFDQKVNDAYLKPTLSSPSSFELSSSNQNPPLGPNFQSPTCKNGETLKRILSSILMLLLQPLDNNSPNLDTINGVLNTLEVHIQSDSLHKIELYSKLETLEKTLRAGPSSNTLYGSQKPKTEFTDCDAAFLKLVALAYASYKQLSKYPDCNMCPFSKDNNPQTNYQLQKNPDTHPYKNSQTYSYQYPDVNPMNSFQTLQIVPTTDQTNSFLNSQKNLHPHFFPSPNSQTSFLNLQTGPIPNYQTNNFQKPQTFLPSDSLINFFLNPQTSPSLNSQMNPIRNPQTGLSPDSITKPLLNPQISPSPSSHTNLLNTETGSSPDSQTNLLNSQTIPASVTQTNSLENAQTSPSSDPYSKPQTYPYNNSPASIIKANPYPANQTSPNPDLHPRLQLEPYPKPQTYPYQNPQNYLNPTHQPYAYPDSSTDFNLVPQKEYYSQPQIHSDSNYQTQLYNPQEYNKPYAKNPTVLQNYFKPLSVKMINEQLRNNPNGKVERVNILTPDEYLHLLDTRESPAKSEPTFQNIFEKLLRSQSPIQRVQPSLLPKVNQTERESSAKEKFDQSLKNAAELLRTLENRQQQPDQVKPLSDTKETVSDTKHLPPWAKLYNETDPKNLAFDSLAPYSNQNQMSKLQAVFPNFKFIPASSEPRIQIPIQVSKSVYQGLKPTSLTNIQEPIKAQSLLKQIPNQIYTYIQSRVQPKNLSNVPQTDQAKQQDQLNSVLSQSNKWPEFAEPSYNNHPLSPVPSNLKNPLKQNEPIAKAPTTLLPLRINFPMSRNFPFLQSDQLKSNPITQNDLLHRYPIHSDSKDVMGACLHNLCNHVLATGHQLKELNIFLSLPCQDFSESQKLFLVQLLQHFQNPQSSEASKENQDIFKGFPDSDKPNIYDENPLDLDHSNINITILASITQLIESSLPNSEDKQIAYNLVQDTITKLKAQGIDFSKNENINLLILFVQKIISQLLNQANISPTINSDSSVILLPGADPAFVKYLHDMLSDQVESVQERQIIISLLNIYINNLTKHGYDIKSQEAMNLIATYMEQLVLQLSRLKITPPTPTDSSVLPYENMKPPSTIVNPVLLESIYKLIISSVPVSQTQDFLTKVKNYIDQLISQGINLNTSENFELLLSYVKELISQIPPESTSLPTMIPTPPTQQINPEFLKNLYEFIELSVKTIEQKEFILEQLQRYINELAKKGVDLSVTENLYILDAFAKQMIDKIVKSRTVSPLDPKLPISLPTEGIPGINRDILHYAYDLIRNFISNPHQEEIATRYFHDYLKYAVESKLDLNIKENIYHVIMSIIDFVKENFASTPSNDIENLHVLPKSVEVTYILNTKMQFGRSGVVKYRVPFDTFLKNIRDILVRAPQQRSQSKLEGVLRSASNITEVSPELQEVPKDRLINLISRSGSFVDADIPPEDIKKFPRNTNELKALEEFKKMVFSVDEKVNNNNRGTIETMNTIKSLNNPPVENENNVNRTYFRRTNNETTAVNESIDRDNEKATSFGDKIASVSEKINSNYKEAGIFKDNTTAVIKPNNRDHKEIGPSDNKIIAVTEEINSGHEEAGLLIDNTTAVTKLNNRDHKDVGPSDGKIIAFGEVINNKTSHFQDNKSTIVEPINLEHKGVPSADDKTIAVSEVINSDYKKAVPSKDKITTVSEPINQDVGANSSNHSLLDKISHSNTKSVT